MRATKNQISLRMRACWSVFIAHIKKLHPWLSKMLPLKNLIRLRDCACWSASLLGANIQMHVFCGIFYFCCIDFIIFGLYFKDLLINPFMHSGLFCLYSSDRSISRRRDVWLVFINAISYRNSFIKCKQCRPCSAASDLDLHCLSLLWGLNGLKCVFGQYWMEQ